MANRSRTSMDRSGVAEILETPGVEYFWSIELNADKKSHTWTVKDENLEEDDEDFLCHSLFIKSAVLGEGAVPGESNIVTLESVDNTSEVQKGAIIHMAKGENNMGQIDISLSGKVGGTFTLTSGSGPVHISGNYLIEYPKPEGLDNTQTDDDSLGEDEIEEMKDEIEEEEEEEEEKPAKGKKGPTKRKAASKPNAKSKQKSKMEVDEDDEEDEDEDEDEEEEESEDEDDEDYEEEKKVTKKTKKPAPAAKKGKVAKTPEVAKKAAKKVKK